MDEGEGEERSGVMLPASRGGQKQIKRSGLTFFRCVFIGNLQYGSCPR